MAIRAQVWRSFYQDSMVLMRLAKELQDRPGVRRSAALMGTPANRELLPRPACPIATLPRRRRAT